MTAMMMSSVGPNDMVLLSSWRSLIRPGSHTTAIAFRYEPPKGP